MKLMSFRKSGVVSWGLKVDGGVADCGPTGRKVAPSLADTLGDLNRIPIGSDTSADHGLEDIEFLPPIAFSDRIICVGLNYRTHIEETGRPAPEHPILFTRFADSIVGHLQPLIVPNASKQLDFEGELAVVIGRPGRNISAQEASAHVAGYTVFNDGSVRDFQRHSSQFMPGKNFWRSGAAGPWITTPDEVGNLSELELTTTLNGNTMQRAFLGDLLFGVDDLISYISKVMPLRSGDLIATGTTGGVGAYRTPPVWMRPGDVVEVHIDGVGSLQNSIADEASISARHAHPDS